MRDVVATDLEHLALDAARQVAGMDCVEEVEVVDRADFWGRPAYLFSFVINQDRAKMTPGLIRIDLNLKLQEELSARGDEHIPMIRMLDRTDWPLRNSA